MRSALEIVLWTALALIVWTQLGYAAVLALLAREWSILPIRAASFDNNC
jgi:hypothetical protein